MKKRMLSLLLVATMMLTAMPLSAWSVSADGATAEVDSWYELREALQSPTITDVYVPQNVTIEQTFDAEKQTEDDWRIDVCGTKHLTVDGTVSFTGSVNDTGLICLWESSSTLTVDGNGVLCYQLRHGPHGDGIIIEEGNLFYLSGGTLTVRDNVQLLVKCAWLDAAHTFRQSVIAGVRGNVNVEGGMLSSHTMFVEGTKWTISGGFLEGAGQYDCDLRVHSGSVKVSGGAFSGGIYYSGQSVVLEKGMNFITTAGTYHETIPVDEPGFVWSCGFAAQNPAPDDGAFITNLGHFSTGTNYPIAFSANPIGYQSPNWDFTLEAQLSVYDRDGNLVTTVTAEGSSMLTYNLQALPSGTYTLVEAVILKNGKTEVLSCIDTFSVALSSSYDPMIRAEIYELQRPTPGQTPDFEVVKDNPPYSEVTAVNWYPMKGKTKGAAMSASDTFRGYTVYRAEITLQAQSGHTFKLDDASAYVWINDAYQSYYYPDPSDRTTVVVYAEYNTANCITDVQIYDVQYPIAGKTPDTTAMSEPYGTAVIEGEDVEWYYETNPGTAVAGFAKLDGKFKSDRRHQAYVDIQTEDGRWFATDKNGKLLVNVTFDGVPVDFSYSTDSRLDDGAVNTIEAACTYDLAKNVDGIFVGGLWLQNDRYVSTLQYGVRTEDTVNKDNGYAYYKDGVLTLHGFEWWTDGDYNAVDSYRALTVKAEGESWLRSSKAYGFSTAEPLTLTGDGETIVYCAYAAVFAMDTLTVQSGTWDLCSELYEGVWLFGDMTMNGGYVEAYGPNSGLYGDDFPTVTINGGTLIAGSDRDHAIGWCDVEIADNAMVKVNSEPDMATAYTWDGVTSFDEYAYVEIALENEVLLGDMNFDGALNTMDALLLFGCVNGAREMTTAQEAVADYTEDGNINMMDALRLFKTVSGG
ncbi:MAG: hypothetical protein IJB27_05845 [Clostridia bacterium]|nr:hypothetical protein [Clostridia bacterium]